MSSRNESGSSFVAKAEDDLSNSEGSFLNRPVERTNIEISAEHISCAQSTIYPFRKRSSLSQIQSFTTYDHYKKRYCLWTLTIFLAIIGICNFLLSITIINVLRVSKGMESLEVILEENLVKFYGKIDLDNIYLEGGVCEGYGNVPMSLNGDNAGIQVKVKNIRHDTPESGVEVMRNVTKISRVESFEVKDIDGNFVFSTHFPNFELPHGVLNINVKLAQTQRIISPLNTPLNLESNRKIELHGAENLKMEGKEIIWMADNDIKLKSNNSIIINGEHGIFIDIKKIPIATKFHSYEKQIGRYKICICMPRGTLFRIPVFTGNTRVNCANVGTTHDGPCF